MLWESPCSVQVSVSIHNRAPRWLTKREDSPRRAARHACAQLFSFYSQTSAPLAQSNSPRHAVQLHERVRGTRDEGPSCPRRFRAPMQGRCRCRAPPLHSHSVCLSMYVSACGYCRARRSACGCIQSCRPGALHAARRSARAYRAIWARAQRPLARAQAASAHTGHYSLVSGTEKHHWLPHG